jgi:predicted RNA-binding protein YlqC (UPF0109 family)
MTEPTVAKSPEEIIRFITTVLRGVCGDEEADVAIQGTVLLNDIIVIVRAPYAVCGRVIGKNNSTRLALKTILQPYCRRYGYFFQLQIRNPENVIQADDFDKEPLVPQKIRSRYGTRRT